MGSINLVEFVTENKEFDFAAFASAVHIAVRALNAVLDEGLPLHPLQEQRDSVREWRQIGLGIFSLGDMLIKMGIRYGSKESIELCDQIGSVMIKAAVAASADLAKEHKCTYPKYNYEAISSSEFYKNNITPELDEIVKKYGLYNSQLLTCAPTGSLSSMFGVSGGIEPIFANSYTRKTESLHGKDTYYKVYTPIVKEYMEKHGLKDESELPDFFVTAPELNYKERIDMQSIWQKYIDASISSTVNVPNEFTVEQVEQLYLYAWEKGLKGVTIFRDGCKRVGILTTDKQKETEEEYKLDAIKPITRDQLGDRLSGTTYVKNVACGKLYITINRDDNDNLVEVFIDSGKSGGCSANAECLGRYASAAMRSGLSISDIVDITKGVKCSACTQVKGSKIKKIDGLSCGDVVARTIQEEYARYHDAKDTPKAPIKKVPAIKKDTPIKTETAKMICPDCGEELSPEGGCMTCHNCGYSKCE